MPGGVRNCCWAEEAAAVDMGMATGDCGRWYEATPSGIVNAEEVVVLANGDMIVGWNPPLLMLVDAVGGCIGAGIVGTIAIISASLCLR